MLLGAGRPKGNSTAPPTVSITGVVTKAGSLTATEGGTVTSRQWQRGNVFEGVGSYSACGGSDSGATYTPVKADIGYSITCLSTGPGGSTRSNALAFSLTQAAGCTLLMHHDADLGVLEGAADPAEDGDPIRSWEDQSGNANDLTQGTLANRPIYATASGPNGHAAIDMRDVATDPKYLDLSTLPGALSAVTVFLVYTHGGKALGFTFDMATPEVAVYRNNLAMYAGADGLNLANPGGFFVEACVFNGASSKHAINGGATSTGNVGANTAGTDFRLGNTQGAANLAFSLNGYFGKILFYSSAMADADRADTTDYLLNWTGL
jgi:hypothetical protein